MRKLAGIAVAVVLLTSMPAVAVAAVVPAKPSDFDGDGYADLAIGVPGEEVDGHPHAGALNVLYGSPSGLTALGDQVWTQDSAGIPDASEPGDRFGRTVASADFDRDGFADLVVGADEGTGTGVNGSLTVIHGTADGLRAANSVVWTEADLGSLLGSGGVFGTALAAGDYDGDGYPDLAVGVSEYRGANDSFEPGVVDIIFGGPAGLAAVGAMKVSAATLGVPGDPNPMEQFGFALSSGDFDGDGIDDLAVGIPGDSVGTFDPEAAGGVNILYGTVDGPTGTGAQLWTQDSPGIGGSADSGEFFGRALATGDFDRDGYDDLAVGVPRDRFSGTKPGAVNVIYGSAGGLTASGSKWWHQGSAGVPGSNESSDAFGWELAAGDFNSDGADDLAVGAPTENVGRIRDAGAVTLLYGSRTGIRASGAVTLTQNTPGVPGKAEAADRFGTVLAVGNYGRSGRDDLAIGVPSEKIRIARGGGVDVLYGRLSGLNGTGAQAWSQGSPGVIGIIHDDDTFGWALTP